MNLLIRLSAYVKVALIHIVDFLDGLHDPFVEFTRPIVIKDPATLADKAARFEAQFTADFLKYGSIFAYQLPINTGDQCLYQGYAAAMWALKYGVTQDADALKSLLAALKGMQEHQTIHGEAAPRLIRGWRALGDGNLPPPSSVQSFTLKDGLIIEDWASNDSVAGHLVGIYFAWLYGDSVARDIAVELITGLADEIAAHDGIIDAAGVCTPFGLLLNGVLTDPLRLATYLAVMAVASLITRNPNYQSLYCYVRRAHGNLANYAKVKLWAWDTVEDTSRAAFLLSILADIAHNDYAQGLWRTWRIAHKSMNVLVAFLAARHNLPTYEEALVAREILSEFTVEDKSGNIEKINSINPLVDTVNWGGHLRSRSPLPAHRRGAQEFVWARNLFSVDDWLGVKTPTIRFNGLDFLLAYWLGRQLQIISPKD